MITHNIPFHREIRKICGFSLLSGAGKKLTCDRALNKTFVFRPKGSYFAKLFLMSTSAHNKSFHEKKEKYCDAPSYLEL